MVALWLSNAYWQAEVRRQTRYLDPGNLLHRNPKLVSMGTVIFSLISMTTGIEVACGRGPVALQNRGREEPARRYHGHLIVLKLRSNLYRGAVIS